MPDPGGVAGNQEKTAEKPPTREIVKESCPDFASVVTIVIRQSIESVEDCLKCDCE
jgi:hypothetical protein